MIYTAPRRLDRQTPFDIAIVLPSLLRPELTRCLRSVFAQDFGGRMQILLGIDKPLGDAGQLEVLARECPEHIALDVIDPGYSTSVRHGGVHENHVSGSLRTVLTFLANSRYVAYLDDDNWWAPNHLSGLRKAIDGREWSWSLRWFVEPGHTEPLCVDEWESLGVGRGVFKEKFGGFVDPSSLMIDKLSCADVVPSWSKTPFSDGRGSDRLVFSGLMKHRHGATGVPSSYYTITASDVLHATRLRWFRQKGVSLATDDARPRKTVRDLVKEFAPQSAPGESRPVASPLEDAVLLALLGQLKPTDMIVVGDETGAVTLSLAAAVRAAGLDCPILATGLSRPASHEKLARALRGAAAPGVLALLPLAQSGSKYLSSQKVEADLIYLGPEIVGLSALSKIWPLLRVAGFLIGYGDASGVAAKFAAEQNSGIVALQLAGQPKGWIIEKGVPAA